MDLKYTDILKENRKLLEQLSGEIYRITVLSNIVINQFKDLFEYSLRSRGIKVVCKFGGYDTIVQDSGHAALNSELVLLFWEACNFIDGFSFKAELMSSEELDQFISKMKSDIDLTFQHLEKAPLVLMNNFSSLAITRQSLRYTNFESVCDQLNAHLKEHAPANVIVIDTDKILAELSIPQSLNLRDYYSSKMLYSFSFLKAYSEYVTPLVLSVQGRGKKALILDCDNTLWGGIIGEDGLDGIALGTEDSRGAIFQEVQSIVKALGGQGVIVGICSKNNEEDVRAVLDGHPQMVLRSEDIVIQRVNWSDKVTNLKAIAADLNIGLESFVFVDDSKFEIGFVNQFLPEVTTVCVPEELHCYPEVMRRTLSLFHVTSLSLEDKERGQMYREETQRKQEKEVYTNVEEYLHALDLELTMFVDTANLIARIAQLSQKTNQFNLTTKRYTEAQIQHFIESSDHQVFAFDAKDRFGQFGVTGVAIIKRDQHVAHIDSLLMSCRVLGRNLEKAFFDAIIKHLRGQMVEHLSAEYHATTKNQQVEDLFERLGFSVVERSKKEKKYFLDLKQYPESEISYIKVKYDQ